MSLVAAWKREALMYRAELHAEQRRSQSYRWHLDRIARARATTTEYYHHRMQLYRAHCQRRLLAASEQVREAKEELRTRTAYYDSDIIRLRRVQTEMFLDIGKLEAENARLRARLDVLEAERREMQDERKEGE